VETVQSLLSDTLVQGFMDAYTGSDANCETAPFDADLHKMAHVVIKLSIMVMADYIA